LHIKANAEHTCSKYFSFPSGFLEHALYLLLQHRWKPAEDTGKALSSDVLSYGAIIFGSVAGWAPIAADYNVRLPANTNSWRVFWLTFFGLFLPIVFTVMLGAALMTITDPAYVAALGSSGDTGALIA
jgi:purine-cytosine permease-like protein